MKESSLVDGKRGRERDIGTWEERSVDNRRDGKASACVCVHLSRLSVVPKIDSIEHLWSLGCRQ